MTEASSRPTSRFSHVFSSAACVIMESDLGAFDQGYEEEIDHFLTAMGVAPLCTAANAGDAGGCHNVYTEDCARTPSAGGNDTAGAVDLTGTQGTATRSAETPWVGTDVSAASTLVILVTAICRRVL